MLPINSFNNYKVSQKLMSSQISIINTLMKEFHSSKLKYVSKGLTTRQLDIFNGLIIEFTKIE